MTEALLASCLLIALAQTGRAEDDPTAAIINKAVKAHFPKGLDTNNKGLRTKSKGTLHVMGLDLEFTQEVSAQMPDRFKEVMELTVMNKTVKVTSVYDGKKAWIRADDKDVPVTKEILAEFREAAHNMGLVQGIFLKDKSVKFSPLGEVTVKGKPALGVTASRKGNKDVNLYFDKKTGLLAKVELRKRDLMGGQEVTEERFVTEYQEVKGRKVAKKVEVVRDGKPFIELEVMDVEILENLDDSEFAKPS